jgi:hypothetical protein
VAAYSSAEEDAALTAEAGTAARVRAPAPDREAAPVEGIGVPNGRPIRDDAGDAVPAPVDILAAGCPGLGLTVALVLPA